MSLEKYCHGRLVVLRPAARAIDAARAMKNNHIGAVLVQAKGRLAGIVTDRDLAVRGLARDAERSLEELMTPDPVTVDIDDSEEQAADLMRVMHVRRLVVLSHGKLAGIVTLDDLILSRAVGFDDVRDVIYAQLADEAPAKPAGYTRPVRLRADSATGARRRVARREQTLHSFARRVMKLSGLADRDRAVSAFLVLAAGLVRRLPPPEAEDFAAQLPADVRALLLDLPPGPDRSVSVQTIIDDMAWRLDLDPHRAEELVTRLARGLSELVSPGELKDVASQLPKAMQRMLGHEPDGGRAGR